MANIVLIKLFGRTTGFQSNEDYERVLLQGLWVIFCQYLTVQPWSLEFNPAQPFSSAVMAWIRFPGYMYKQKVLINGNIHRVEYKHLPSIYFSCRRYGYRKGVCTNTVSGSMTNIAAVESGGSDGPRHMARG
ncbi:hypothetical protein GOBAR_DD00529 [Gossypium barbadense]|nr:hypothetical protein GOBAR_DD00529 [Gossypium barbadense]